MNVGTETLTGQPFEPPPARPAAIKAIPLRHPWRWVAAVVVLAIAAEAVYTFAAAPALDWRVVGQYLFFPEILRGIVVTLELTVIAMAIGAILGVILAVMRLSVNPVVSTLSWFYIWFFRGTPVLVQLFFWYNIALILPHLSIGIPFTNIEWVGTTNQIVSPFLAAILGLGLNEAAYMSEVVRAGIISVDHGQTEAAQALGMTRIGVMRRIVLPQAMRVILPPTGNETISMLKTSSLAYITTVAELFYVQTEISNANFRHRRAVDRRQRLVPGHDLHPHVRSVLPRAVLRARFGTPAAAHPDPALSPDAVPCSHRCADSCIRVGRDLHTAHLGSR